MHSADRKLRRRRGAWVALAALGAWAGCHATGEPPPEPLPPTPAGLEVRPLGDGTFAVVVHPIAGAAPRLTCTGVRVVTATPAGRRERELAFTAVSVDGAVTARCEPIADHAIRVTWRSRGADRWHAELVDDIELRADLLELGLSYEIEGLGRIDERQVPHAHPEAADAAGDAAFASPVVFARSGNLAVGLTPDPTPTAGRLAQALELDTDGPVRIRHGLCALRPVERGGQVAMTREGALASPFRGERLAAGHTLHLLTTAAPLMTATWLHAQLWHTHDRPPPVRTRRELTAWDRRCGDLLAEAIEGGYRELDLVGRSFATLVPPAEEAPGVDAWFTAARQLLRTAAGLARFGHRHELDDWALRATRMVDLALAAPRAGPFPGRVRFDETHQRIVWLNDARTALPPGDFVLADAAVTGYWLLQLADELPSRRSLVLDRCASLTRFLVSNQEAIATGRLPSRYTPEYQQPCPDPEPVADTAFGALYLAEYARATGDATAHLAAARALDHVVDAHLRTGIWTDVETAALGAAADPRSGAPRRGTLAVIAATRAAATLAELDPSDRARDVTARLAEQLFPHQQVQPAPDGLGVSRGSLEANDLSLVAGDPRGALAADALLSAYAVTGRIDFLHRGAAALAATLWRDDAGRDHHGSIAARPDWGPATAVPVVERAWRSLGHGVVDLVSGTAVGLDALWFEDLTIEADRVSFALLTHAAHELPVQIGFRGLAPDSPPIRLQVNGQPLGPFAAEALSLGLSLRPRRVPLVEFTPPSELAQGRLWQPRALAFGPIDGSSITLELGVGDDQTTPLHLRMIPGGPDTVPPDPRATVLIAERPITPEEFAGVDSLEARLIVEQAGRRELVPSERPHSIAFGAMTAIEAGLGDALDLLPGSRSRVVRFPGRPRPGRAARGDESFAYAIGIGEADEVDLRITLAGPVHVTAGDVTIHRDRASGERELALALSDQRLWDGGRLVLGFAPASAEAEVVVARVEYAARGGIAARRQPAEGGHERPDQSIHVAVIPISFADAPLSVGVEALRQAFFGGPAYRSTPPPEPRLTTGSAAALIEEMSGGASRLSGRVTEPVSSPLAIAEFTAGDAGSAAAAALAAALTSGDSTPFDAVVVVHAGRVVPLRDGQPASALPVGGVPWIFVPEREADGSLLASGRIVRTVLVALGRAEAVDTPAGGNFGELALSGDSGSHTPADLLGINMARAGWADEHRVEPEDAASGRTTGRHVGPPRRVRVAPLREGRALTRLVCGHLPDRGDLLLESRRGSATTPYARGGGLLAYWDLGAAPPIVCAGPHAERVRLLRLSPAVPTWATSFRPGSADDLFRSGSVLDAGSRPALVTPQGEAVWSIGDLHIDERFVATFELRYTPLELVERRDTAWQAVSAGGISPLAATTAGDAGPAPSVVRLAGGYRLAAHAETSVEGRFVLDTGIGRHRALVHCSDIHGSGQLTLGLDRGETAAFRIDGDGEGRWFELDLPATPAGERLLLAIRTDRALSLRIDRCTILAVAQPTRPAVLRLPVRRGVTLQDDCGYGQTVIARIGPDGTAAESAIMLLDGGDFTVHLRCGLAAGAREASTITLAASVSQRETGWRRVLAEGIALRRGAGRTPLFLVKAAVADAPDGIAELELRLTGDPGDELHIVQAGYGPR